MTRAKVERFSVPQLFEDADISRNTCPIDLPDVSRSRKEVWLIRAPLNFDGSVLNDVTLDLEGDSVEFSSVNQDTKKYEAVAVRELQENEAQSPYLLLPSTEMKTLDPGPAFRGQIIIMESLNSQSSLPELPDIKPSQAPKMPEGLRQRFKPYGSDEPWQRESQSRGSGQTHKKKQKKRKAGDVDDEDGDERLHGVDGLDTVDGQRTNNDREGEADSSQRKSKKKKMKRKHEDELVLEEVHPIPRQRTVEEENAASPKKKKKKKKSKD